MIGKSTALNSPTETGREGGRKRWRGKGWREREREGWRGRDREGREVRGKEGLIQ